MDSHHFHRFIGIIITSADSISCIVLSWDPHFSTSLLRYFALAIFTRVFAFSSEIPPSAIYGTMRCIFPSFFPNITISSRISSCAVSPGDLSARPAGRVYFPASDGAQISLLSKGILSHSAVWTLIAPTPEKRTPALLL